MEAIPVSSLATYLWSDCIVFFPSCTSMGCCCGIAVRSAAAPHQPQNGHGRCSIFSSRNPDGLIHGRLGCAFRRCGSPFGRYNITKLMRPSDAAFARLFFVSISAMLEHAVYMHVRPGTNPPSVASPNDLTLERAIPKCCHVN